VQIPLIQGTVPASLVKIHLEIDVAGRQITQSFNPAPNQTYSFTWDGKDAVGRTVIGAVPLTAKVSYEYLGQYGVSESFGSSSGLGVAGDNVTGDVSLAAVMTTTVGHWSNQADTLGGWSLNVHHDYDPVAQQLYLGDGTQQAAQGIGRTASVVKGLENGPSTRGVAAAPDGEVYYSDFYGNRVIKVDPDGTTHTVAGTGTGGFSGDNGPATSAQISQPTSIGFDAAGDLFILDQGNNRIRKVSPDGTITTVAGNGTIQSSGDGGPATQAGFGGYYNGPDSMAVAPDGTLYVGQDTPGAVRVITPNGIINTFAGGGPAPNYKKVYLYNVPQIAVGPDGSVYLVNNNYCCGSNNLYKITPDGTVHTITSGTSTTAAPPDGGTLPNSQYGDVTGALTVDHEGNLYYTASGGCNNSCVRMVTPAGVVNRVAGPPGTGPTTTINGGNARQTMLGNAQALAIGPDDSLYVGIAGTPSIWHISSGLLPRYNQSGYTIPSPDGTEVYEFDQTGRHLDTVDSLTAATRYRFDYDSQGRLSRITDANGNSTTINRDPTGNPTGITGPYGQHTTLATDANGWLSQISDPAGNTYHMTTGPTGLLASFADPNANASSFSYDANGLLTQDTDAAGGYTHLTRSSLADGYQVALSTAMGRTTTHQVELLPGDAIKRTLTDPAGLTSTSTSTPSAQTTTTAPNGTSTTSQLQGDPRFGMQAPFAQVFSLATPGGLSLNITGSRALTLSNPSDPLSLQSLTDTTTTNGQAQTDTYTQATKTWTHRTPAGRTISTTIDSQENPTQLELPGQAAIQNSYDSHGRLTQTQQASRSTTYSYDASGRPATVTDPAGRVSAYGYDSADRLTTQTLPDGRQISFGYDAAGNLTSITPPTRPAHTFAYTAVNQRLAYTPPTLSASPTPTQYAYNLDRQLTQITRPNGDQIGFSYDTAGRPSSVDLPGNQHIAYTYDSQGRLHQATAPGGQSTTYAYDGPLPTSATQAGPVAGTITTSYDNNLRPTSQSINGANSITYTYDPDSLLTNAGSLTLARDPASGQITGTTLGNLTSALSYDPTYGELATLAYSNGNSNLLSLSYTRDKLGRVTQVAETTPSGTHTTAYTYDTAGQLTTVTRDGSTTAQYQYDLNGNRTNYTDANNSATTATYDDQDRLLSYGTLTYAYNANGERTSATDTASNQTTTYGYDTLGQLTTVALPNGHTITYTYDADGNRIARADNGTTTDEYLYDGPGGPVARLDANGTLLAQYVYAGNPYTPAYIIQAGHTYQLLTDQLGSVRQVIDTSTGTTAEALTYDEFGNTLQDTNPGFQPFGYAGGTTDPDTHLTHLQARDYDPHTGRFLTKDPTDFAGGDTNLYRYTTNDPINAIDPAGTDSSDVGRSASYFSNEARGTLSTLTFGISERLACALGAAPPGSGYGLGQLLPLPFAFARGAIEEAATGFGPLSRAGDFGVWPYRTLRTDLKGTGLQTHHLIEKRFAAVMGQSPGEMASIAVTASEHQAFTNAWRQAIPYGAGTRAATRAQVEGVAKDVYAAYPDIMSALGLP
jgi:RHS repeat-associated protein